MLDKELLKYIKGKKKNIAIIVIFNVLGLFLSVAITASLIFAVKNFINRDMFKGIYLLLLTISCALLKVITAYVSSYSSNKLADYVVYKLRYDTYFKYLNLKGKTPFTTSEMAQLSTEGIEQLRLYYSVYIPSFFYAMIAPLLLFVMFMFIDVPVAIVYLVCVPLIPASIIMVSKWAKKIFNKYWDKYTALGDSFLDNTSGMKELKIFLYDKKRQEEMMEESEGFRKITMKVLTMQLASVTIMDLVAFGGAGIGIVLSLNAMLNGLDVYKTLFMVLIGAEFFLPMRALGSSFHVAMNGATAGKKVIKLLEQKEEKRINKELENISNVSLEKVAFSYDQKNVLENINIKLDKGFYSIVGVSGSGKSTIAKLFINDIKANEGIVKINQTDINEVSLSSFYKKMCYVSNNTYLFHQSIKESFKFYNNSISEEKMKELLRIVKLDYFTDLDYVINDTSTNISGGEKQRLILAFYLANEYDFYIFDEATSNIDVDSEKIILDVIKEIAKEKIVLFISHRLKNVIDSKYIYYLQDGNIVEEGSGEYLLSTNSKFKQLYDYQSELEEVRYEKA